MNDIKVIFVDIDNTIFDHIKKHRYDLKSIKYLNKLKSRGIKIIICSARPIYSLREFGVFNRLKYDGVIASNGAVRIYNHEWFDQYFFPKDKLPKIIKVCEKYKLCVEFVTFDNRFYATPKTNAVDIHHKYYFENEAKEEKYIDQKVISMLLFAEEYHDDNLKREFPKDLNLYRFSSCGIDVIPKPHSKGEAIKSMLKKMNIDKNNSLAFGDDMQDISMFEEVQYGIALGNAKEEVKRAACFVCKPVYKHGVYHFLRKSKIVKLYPKQ